MELNESAYSDHVALKWQDVLTYSSLKLPLLGGPQRSLNDFYIKKASGFTRRTDTSFIKKAK